MSAYSLSVCNIVSMSLVTCQNGLLFLVLVVHFLVVVSFSTLAGNGGNLPQAGNTKIRMSSKLQNTTNFPPKHVQPGLRQIAVMAGSPSKAYSWQLL